MKNLARSFVWWPGIDNDLEERVKLCERTRHQPPPTLGRWVRIHADYAGPIEWTC